jgi:protein-S-isoprenylcysteine O-methyltransferase Ste14
MLMLKRQNIQGNILGKGQKPKGEAAFEKILKVFTSLMVPVQFGNVFFHDDIFNLPFQFVLNIIGFVFLLLADAIFLSAVITMRNNWRAGYSYEQDTKLVTNSIYKISRNPAFVGFDLLYIGSALLYPNIINIVFTLVVIILFHVQILGEEKFLVGKFGENYLEYKSKVRRYL